MNRATPKARKLAEHLLRFEAATGKAGAEGTAAARACEKLRHVLSALLGAAGFRALLLRALTLAQGEVSGIRAVQVRADGSLEGLSASGPQSGDGKIAKEEVILIAHLLGLLIVFVGEALMLRLVQDAWPKATLDPFYSDEGESQ